MKEPKEKRANNAGTLVGCSKGLSALRSLFCARGIQLARTEMGDCELIVHHAPKQTLRPHTSTSDMATMPMHRTRRQQYARSAHSHRLHPVPTQAREVTHRPSLPPSSQALKVSNFTTSCFLRWALLALCCSPIEQGCVDCDSKKRQDRKYDNTQHATLYRPSVFRICKMQVCDSVSVSYEAALHR